MGEAAKDMLGMEDIDEQRSVDRADKRSDLHTVRDVDNVVNGVGKNVRETMDDKLGKQTDVFIQQLPMMDGAVDFLELEKIGKGGTHDVYQDPKNSAFVIKVNRNSLSADGNTFGRAKAYIDNKTQENNELYRAFGSENCAREKMFVAKGRFSSGKRSPQNALLIVQEQNEALSKKEVVDFGFNYKHKWRKGLKRRMSKDQKFEDKVVEFMLKFRDYFNGTGNFIDLVGEKNVVFYKDSSGRWQYKIGSVLKGDTRDKFLQIYQKMVVDPKSLKSLSDEDKTTFNNGIASVKCLNEMGMWLGIGTIAYLPVTDRGINSGR